MTHTLDIKIEGRETLRSHFGKCRAKIYVGSELTVYYPEERRFSPDLFAVRDVEPVPREKWVVSDEGRGLEWILEIIVSGRRRKDLITNVARYARLGILEYFVYDRKRDVFRAWRLPHPKARIYEQVAPQRGVFRSEVLDMDVFVEDFRVRFRWGNANILAPNDLVQQLETQATQLIVAREEAERQREEALQRVRELEAELAGVRRGEP